MPRGLFFTGRGRAKRLPGSQIFSTEQHVPCTAEIPAQMQEECLCQLCPGSCFRCGRFSGQRALACRKHHLGRMACGNRMGTSVSLCRCRGECHSRSCLPSQCTYNQSGVSMKICIVIPVDSWHLKRLTAQPLKHPSKTPVDLGEHHSG